MYKVAWIPRFAYGTNIDAAWERWARAHADAVLALPGVVTYVQNALLTRGGTARTDGIAGLACAWWADRDSFDHALADPTWCQLEKIEQDVLDPVWSSLGMTAEIREQLMRRGLGADTSPARLPRPGSLKEVGILRFRHGLHPEDAFDYWRNVHGQFPLQVPQLGHYVQNHATAAITGDGQVAGRPAFDGFSEAYFADDATRDAGHAAQGWKGLEADAPNLLDRDFRIGGAMEEIVLKAG